MRNLLLVFLALAFLLIPCPSLAGPGDTLYVQKSVANVRTGPGTSHSILFQVEQGHKLMEFGRERRWVNVGISGTGGKDGWIHGSLVGSTFVPASPKVSSTNAKFEEFKQAVQKLNSRVRQAAGVDFFTRVEDLGDGIVRLTASNLWASAPYGDRQGNLNTLFNLWDAADGTGLAIAVQVVDQRGNEIMHKARR